MRRLIFFSNDEISMVDKRKLVDDKRLENLRLMRERLAEKRQLEKEQKEAEKAEKKQTKKNKAPVKPLTEPEEDIELDEPDEEELMSEHEEETPPPPKTVKRTKATPRMQQQPDLLWSVRQILDTEYPELKEARKTKKWLARKEELKNEILSSLTLSDTPSPQTSRQHAPAPRTSSYDEKDFFW